MVLSDYLTIRGCGGPAGEPLSPFTPPAPSDGWRFMVWLQCQLLLPIRIADNAKCAGCDGSHVDALTPQYGFFLYPQLVSAFSFAGSIRTADTQS